MIALCSWLLPYEWIHNVISQYKVLHLPLSLADYGESLKQVIVPQLTTLNPLLSLSLIFTILSMVGFFLFINDVLNLSRKLKKQQKVANFYKNINGINCFSVLQINAAFSSGIIKPVIWFDDKYINHQNLESLLQHELQHIKQFDHLWLLIITFIQRLLWWNPLVILLSEKARALIELSCDQACANKIGKDTYQKHLANLMINQQHSSSPVLVNNFFGKNTFNIFRIKKLSEEFIMNKKHKSTLLLSLVMMISILLISMQSVSMQANENIPFEEVKLTENQIIVETLVTLYTNYKYENVKHVDNPSENSKRVSGYDKKSFEAKLVVELGKPFKFSADELKGFEFEATATKTKDNNIFMQTDVKFISKGKNIHMQPAMFVEPSPKFARIEITDDEGDDYKLEMKFTIQQHK